MDRKRCDDGLPEANGEGGGAFAICPELKEGHLGQRIGFHGGDAGSILAFDDCRVLAWGQDRD